MRRIPVMVLVLVLAACGDDAGGVTATTVGTTTTTRVETTTTLDSTTQPTTTTAPTTTAATTTTVPAPVFGFFPDGLGVVDFGSSAEEVMAVLDPLFGPPTKDTGWIAEPLCPPPTYRLINYGALPFDLTVIFTTAEWFAPAGVQHFFGYSYKGALTVPVDPPALTVGTTLAELQALHPGVQIVVHPVLDNAYQFTVTGDGKERIRGALDGNAAGSTVTEIRGGGTCGE